MVAHPRAATVMGLLEEARLARMRGFKVAQKNGSMKTAFGQVRDWFVGNGPSLADIALFAYTHVAEAGEFALSDYPHVKAWLGRVAALPGYVPME